MEEYRTGLASLFTVKAREDRQYVYHFDHANQKWNVFHVKGGQENYVCSFDTLIDAQDFCDINNIDFSGLKQSDR